MTNKIKFVWDYYGIDSKKTAKHSLVHLEDFLKKNKINIYSKGIENQSDNHYYSFVILNISHLKFIKEKLAPNRAFYY